jgi:WD40 repeat protein
MKINTVWSESQKTSETLKKTNCFSSTLNGKFNLVGLENSIEIRHSKDNSLVNRLNDQNTVQISQIKISPYGNYFVTISENLKVTIWDGSSLEVLKKFTLESNKEEIFLVEFSKNETVLYIITDSNLYQFKLNEKEKTKQFNKLSFADRKVTSAVLMEDLGYLLVSDVTNLLCAIDV